MSIDFFVIGAQKAGTTSLHSHLSSHPKIILPKEKEAPFFYDSSMYRKGFDWFVRTFFPKKKDGELFGSVTPQYMGYLESISRIYEACPNCQIIAILRDPIARARSHYRMRVRAFGERRSFEEAITFQLRAETLVDQRQSPSKTDSYIVWGEYGRILAEYLKTFEKERLLVLFLDDLERNPHFEIKKIHTFLGVNPIEVKNAGLRHHVGSGNKNWSLRSATANLLDNNVVKRVGRWLIPSSIKRRLVFWSIVNRNQARKSDLMDAKLEPQTLNALRSHFYEDLVLLEEQCGVAQIPWKDELKASNYEGSVKH